MTTDSLTFIMLAVGAPVDELRGSCHEIEELPIGFNGVSQGRFKMGGDSRADSLQILHVHDLIDARERIDQAAVLPAMIIERGVIDARHDEFLAPEMGRVESLQPKQLLPGFGNPSVVDRGPDPAYQIG